jgi:hypothetical protein
MNQTMVAIPIPLELHQQFKVLSQRLHSGERESLAKEAGLLISDVACDVIETIFGQMLDRMAEASGKTHYQDAHAAVSEVKSVLRKYLPWATGFFDNQRLSPVARHFESLMHEYVDEQGQEQTFLTFSISTELAQKARQSLAKLRAGQAKDGREAVEVLIEVIEAGLEPLLYTPKRLLKFNFVADKTLNGVIAVTNALAFRQLRKLGEHLSPTLFAPVADHLEQFLKDQV